MPLPGYHFLVTQDDPHHLFAFCVLLQWQVLFDRNPVPSVI